MSSTIHFGGLSSGIDTDALITALMAVEKQPLTSLQDRISKVDSAKVTVNAFTTKLNTLGTAAKALSTLSGFTSMSATSSDTAIVATANGAASPGSFDISVQALAKEQRTYSDAQTSDTTALGISGTLSLAVGSGTAKNLTIDSTDNLASIATKINAAGLRVSASVLSTASGYKLQVRGLDTGASNGVSITETGFALGLSKVANTYQSAADAKIVVDGSTITRATNQFTDVIPGVTLAVTKLTTSPATVTLATDPNGLQSKLTTFINAFNDVMSTGQSAIGYGSTKALNSELAGDTSIRTSMAQISSVVTNPTAVGTSVYTTLGSVGVQIDRNGRLSLDTTKLGKALTADPAGVARLFTGATGSDGIMTTISKKTLALTTDANAIMQSRLDSFDSLRKRLVSDSDSMQTRLDKMEENLRSQYTNLETMMSKYKAASSALTSLSTMTSTTG